MILKVSMSSIYFFCCLKKDLCYTKNIEVLYNEKDNGRKRENTSTVDKLFFK